MNKKEFIRDIPSLTIEEQDKIEAQVFISSSILTREEFDSLYWQVQLIHQSIDYSKLRQYCYLRLRNSQENKYHNLWMEIDDDKDGIYKQIQISPDDLNTYIEQCKDLNNGYCIYEKVVYWNECEIYFSRTLLKTNYPKNNEFIPLASKEWLYDGLNLTPFKEIKNENYTDFNLKYLQELEEVQKERKKHYIKCLSKNNKLKG